MRRPLKILAFAYVYPPDAGSGTFRTLNFTNCWAEAGDSVTVVTAREEDFREDASIDHQLVGRIHSSIRVHRAKVARPHDRIISWRARWTKRGSKDSGGSQESTTSTSTEGRPGFGQRIKDLVSNFLMFPDAHSGWIVDASRKGLSAARRGSIDCIYASGGPWSGMIAALIVHKLRRVPLILDFRDPWSSNPNLRYHSPLLRAAHSRMERICIGNAAKIVANTEELRTDLVRRYAHLDPSRFITITNGFEEIERAMATTPTDMFTLVHAGALYAPRNPVNLLSALLELVNTGQIRRANLKLRFVGGIESSHPSLHATLNELKGCVEILPRVPHAEALLLQQKASALLLFQTGFPLQIPRKLYEYFSLGLPIMAIADRDGATSRILDHVGTQYMCEDDVQAIKQVLNKLYRDWRDGTLEPPNQEKLSEFSNRHLAARLREEMAVVVGREKT